MRKLVFASLKPRLLSHELDQLLSSYISNHLAKLLGLQALVVSRKSVRWLQEEIMQRLSAGSNTGRASTAEKTIEKLNNSERKAFLHPFVCLNPHHNELENS